MQTPPPAAVPARNVGPAIVPTPVEEHCFGILAYGKAPLHERFWAGNMHRPRIIEAELIYGPPGAKQTRTVAKVAQSLQKLPRGTEVSMYVYRMSLPPIQRPDEAILLQGGPNPDAVITAVGAKDMVHCRYFVPSSFALQHKLPKETTWVVLNQGQGNNWNMKAIIDQHLRGRSRSPRKRTGNSPNRAGGTPRGSPSRSGTAPGTGGAR